MFLFLHPTFFFLASSLLPLVSFPLFTFLPPGGYLISSLLFFFLLVFFGYTCSYSTLQKRASSIPLIVYIIPLPPLPLFPLPHLLHFILSRWTLCRSNISTVPRNRQLTRLPSRQKRTQGQEEQQLATTTITIATTTRLLDHNRIVVIRVCVHATSVENAR